MRVIERSLAFGQDWSGIGTRKSEWRHL